MVTCVSTAGPSDGLIAGFFLTIQSEISKRFEHVALNSMFTCNCSCVFEAAWLAGDICLHDWGKKITSAEKVF